MILGAVALLRQEGSRYSLGRLDVARSGDCPKVFRLRRCSEQRSTESHWDNIISAAVNE